MRLTQHSGLIVAPLALAFVAVACGGSTSAEVIDRDGPDGVASIATPLDIRAPADPSPALPEDREEALLVYAQCMRDNDIDMDDPQPGAGGRGFLRGGAGGGIDRQSPEFQAAQEICGSILEAARPELDPEAQAERLEENLALAQCLRDHGYADYPDPVMGSDGRLQRFGGRQLGEIGIDFRSDAFQTARQTCATTLDIEIGPGGRGRQGGN